MAQDPAIFDAVAFNKLSPEQKMEELKKAFKPLKDQLEASIAAEAAKSPEQKYQEYRQRQRPVLLKYGAMETWKLKQEAIPLLLGKDPDALLDPGWPIRQPNGQYGSKGNLWDAFQRAVYAGGLTVENPSASPELWHVRPDRFLAFCDERGIKYHDDLRAVVRHRTALIAKPTPTISTAHQKMLAVGYTTPALEAAYAAIAEFWLNFDPNKSGPRPTSAKVRDWLMKNFGPKTKYALTKNEIDQIDRLIRHPSVREGGNLKVRR